MCVYYVYIVIFMVISRFMFIPWLVGYITVWAGENSFKKNPDQIMMLAGIEKSFQRIKAVVVSLDVTCTWMRRDSRRYF
jgi:hypothetical protein